MRETDPHEPFAELLDAEAERDESDAERRAIVTVGDVETVCSHGAQEARQTEARLSGDAHKTAVSTATAVSVEPLVLMEEISAF